VGFLKRTVAPYLWMFLLGALLQRNRTNVRGWLAGRAHWWLAGYVLVCLLARLLRIDSGGNDISPLFLLPLAGLVASLALTVPSWSDRTLRHQDVSYGLYIYHLLVIHLMVLLGLTSVTLAVAISLVVATISWLLVERPFLERKRRALHWVIPPAQPR